MSSVSGMPAKHQLVILCAGAIAVDLYSYRVSFDEFPDPTAPTFFWRLSALLVGPVGTSFAGHVASAAVTARVRVDFIDCVFEVSVHGGGGR